MSSFLLTIDLLFSHGFYFMKKSQEAKENQMRERETDEAKYGKW